jgi:hypothetical protein
MGDVGDSGERTTYGGKARTAGTRGVNGGRAPASVTIGYLEAVNRRVSFFCSTPYPIVIIIKPCLNYTRRFVGVWCPAIPKNTAMSCPMKHGTLEFLFSLVKSS